MAEDDFLQPDGEIPVDSSIPGENSIQTTDRKDINGLSLEELIEIPGLTRTLAERLIEGRPYDYLDDLERIKGFSPAKIEDLSEYLWVPPAAPPVLDLPSAASSEAPLPVEEQEPVIEADTRVEEVPLTSPPAETIPPPMEPIVSVPELLPVAPVPAAKPEDDKASAAPVVPAVSGADRPPWRGPRSGETILYSAGFAFVSMLLGIAITLGILALLNGSLFFTPSQRFKDLQGQVNSLNSQVGTLKQDLDSVRTRVDGLSALSGRVNTIENETTALRSLVDQAGQQMKQVQTQIDQISQETAHLQGRAQAFDEFLAGLAGLAQKAAPPAPANETPTPAPTPTVLP